VSQPRFQLFQRDHCPLCDQALAVLAAARVPEFDTIWIDDDEVLEARYGARVPVLRDDRSGRELGWPFGVDGVRAFLDTGD
jgi:glutaredoxin 2